MKQKLEPVTSNLVTLSRSNKELSSNQMLLFYFYALVRQSTFKHDFVKSITFAIIIDLKKFFARYYKKEFLKSDGLNRQKRDGRKSVHTDGQTVLKISDVKTCFLIFSNEKKSSRLKKKIYDNK